MKIEHRKLSDLRLGKTVRIGDLYISELKITIIQMGCIRDPIAIRPDGLVVDGYRRIKAAQEIAEEGKYPETIKTFDAIPCIIVG